MSSKEEIEAEILFVDSSSFTIKVSGIEFIEDFNMVVMEHEEVDATTHYYFNLNQLKGFVTTIKNTKPKLKAV